MLFLSEIYLNDIYNFLKTNYVNNNHHILFDKEYIKWFNNKNYKSFDLTIEKKYFNIGIKENNELVGFIASTPILLKIFKQKLIILVYFAAGLYSFLSITILAMISLSISEVPPPIGPKRLSLNILAKG